MVVTYDKYYQTENLFGEPYPELMGFFSAYPPNGKILDLGCGQGRDSIPLARLGFEVIGIDNSSVGIEQMNKIAKTENLKLKGITADIFEYDEFAEYDFILLDSMFHFTKNDRKKETEFIERILSEIGKECLVILCIQDTGEKVKILNETIDLKYKLDRLVDEKFKYTFEDSESGHKSETNYRMIIIRK
ncbi:class I SAM-dependent methyltransferase [Arcticibacterium luteifluviistationis]|uniref:SAM-dependent methyltransferase n=1 Tax=Arcticibacterium luteifluviistationis TaxID=1784714 RepID=A0A2Z4GHH4_9BACT|nr:class I SAM-dependent methyltransferase [Arcticibacterium luteifluviistationis]AWW00632.1 SAM-dependent methyltransferase [Arcticibacterium luteifluviistationis]